MNVVEELRSLDANDVGRWPLVFRAAVIAIVFVAVLGLGVWFTPFNLIPSISCHL